MTRPRPGWPGTYTITRRTTQRQFLARPDSMVNSIFLYCFAYCCEKFGLQAHALTVLSSHLHLSATDPVGNLMPSFTQLFFSMTARAMNCYIGRMENFWCSPGEPCQVFVNPKAEDLVSQLAYVICNPVTSKLVRTSKQWPGVGILAHQVGKIVLDVPKPQLFFDRDEKKKILPKTIRLTLTLPECVDASPEELGEMLVRKCKQIEEDMQVEMKAKGECFLGAKRAQRTRRTSSPKTPDGRFEMAPRVACKDTEQRVFILELLKEFWVAYAAALQKFRDGMRDVMFPGPTFKMVHILGCEGESVRAPPVIN